MNCRDGTAAALPRSAAQAATTFGWGCGGTPAGALLMSPQFTLAGLPPPPWTRAPQLALPEATTRALCEEHAPRIFADLPLDWRCDDDGLH